MKSGVIWCPEYDEILLKTIYCTMIKSARDKFPVHFRYTGRYLCQKVALTKSRDSLNSAVSLVAIHRRTHWRMSLLLVMFAFLFGQGDYEPS